jgi:predicted secreted protein
MLRHRSFTPLRPLFAAAAVLVLVVAVAGCGDDSDSSSSKAESSSSVVNTFNGYPMYTEDDTDITVKQEHAFVISLPASPSTGYEWNAVSTPAVQQMTTEQVPGGSQPGAQGTQNITFRAGDLGTSTLTLNYARSFEPGVAPAKTVSFQLTTVAG